MKQCYRTLKPTNSNVYDMVNTGNDIKSCPITGPRLTPRKLVVTRCVECKVALFEATGVVIILSTVRKLFNALSYAPETISIILVVPPVPVGNLVIRLRNFLTELKNDDVVVV